MIAVSKMQTRRPENNASRSARPSTVKVLAWPAFENKTGNPYTRLLYEAVEREGGHVDDFTLARALAGGYDLWHVHWPDDFLSFSPAPKALGYVVAELALMGLAKLRGTRLVWTIHDLGPHESRYPWLERWFWSVFTPMVDGSIALSEYARTSAERALPLLRTVPSAVVPHGHYRDAYPEPVGRETARVRLGLDSEAPVAAYVGRIRPYKNVPHLVQTFRQWEEPAARLLVAGNPASDELRRTVEAAAEGDARIRLDLRFIPDDVLARVLGAADLVVLPYADILHSGSALLALSFDRPVLVPAHGAIPELQSHVGPDWVRTYPGDLTPEELRGALDWARTAGRPARAPLGALDWDVLARQTLDLYRRVLSG